MREGLDLPEVALVAIMDADIESYLRDKRSLIQIIGRAARNNESRVLLYADKMTKSMQGAIDETNRRHQLQKAYNEEHGITPITVKREVTKSITDLQKAIAQASKRTNKKKTLPTTPEAIQARMSELEDAMKIAAEDLDFETAISLRDEWHQLQKKLIELAK